jgi:CRP/FNR family cyclic AMP-dependent transcriptional regulator
VARSTNRRDVIAGTGIRDGFLFALPDEAAERLLAGAIQMDVPAGSIIYRGDESPRVFFVLRGLVRVFLSAADGRQVTVRYARPGDLAGLALVLGGPGPQSIQAMTGASVLAFRAGTLRSLIATDPGVGNACAVELTAELYRALGDLSEQAFAPVRRRLVHQLLDLASAGPDGRLVARASQQELADAIASVREVVTRNLHQLQDEGLIQIARDEVALLDPDRLMEEVAEPWIHPGEASSNAG